MNVLYSPRMPKNTIGDGWNVCLGHGIGIRNIPSRPPYTPASFTAYAHNPGLWYGIIKRLVNLYN